MAASEPTFLLSLLENTAVLSRSPHTIAVSQLPAFVVNVDKRVYVLTCEYPSICLHKAQDVFAAIAYALFLFRAALLVTLRALCGSRSSNTCAFAHGARRVIHVTSPDPEST